MPDRTERSPLKINVVVFDQNGDEVRNHRVDYSNPNRRKWYLALCVWAWTNGYAVETCNVQDEGRLFNE